MSNTGKYKLINGELVKVSDKVRLRQSVYWPSNGGFQGRVIENLTPKPTYVKNKDAYRDLLRESGSAEAG